MKRIVAYLKGGLGNQCFIYAATRAHALRTGAELCLSLDYFQEDRIYRRRFELDDFKINGMILPLGFPIKRKLIAVRYQIASKLFKTTRIGNFCCDRQPCCHRPLPIEWNGNLYVDGYWHSHGYFDGAWTSLVEDFQLKDDVWLKTNYFRRLIEAAGSLSVFCHMRSYGEVPGHSNRDMALSVYYYETALAEMSRRIGRMTLFLFSDDLPWAFSRLNAVARRLKVKVVLVEKEAEHDSTIRDFMLMRACRHGIVANSSFSRFAAMLGEREWRKVGFADGVYIRSSSVMPDYCPENWVVVGERG